MRIFSKDGYFKQVMIACNQLCHALFFGGQADETMSSHAWRSREHKYWWWVYKFVNLIFFWEKDHCKNAFQYEIERGHLPLILQRIDLEKFKDHS